MHTTGYQVYLRIWLRSLSNDVWWNRYNRHMRLTNSLNTKLALTNVDAANISCYIWQRRCQLEIPMKFAPIRNSEKASNFFHSFFFFLGENFFIAWKIISIDSFIKVIVSKIKASKKNLMIISCLYVTRSGVPRRTL